MLSFGTLTGHLVHPTMPGRNHLFGTSSLKGLGISDLPPEPRRQVTFKEHSTGERALTGTEPADGSEPVGGGLGPPCFLDPDLEHCFGRVPTLEGSRRREGPPVRSAAQTSPG